MQPQEEELEQLKMLLFSQDEDNYELAMQILRGLNVERWSVWSDLRRCAEFFNEHWFISRDIPTMLRELRKRHLALSSRRLTYLPEFLAVLAPMMQTAILRYNQLTHLPSVLLQYQQLRELDISNNYIAEVDERLFQLPSLQELHLNGNRLYRLPDSITQAQSLKILHIGDLDRDVVALPESFSQLRSLRIFSYWGKLQPTAADQLPQRLFGLENLERLMLFFSDATHTHCSLKGISQLRNLRRIHLQNCSTDFDQWAQELTQLPQLEHLRTRNCLTEKNITQLVTMMPQLKVEFIG